MVKEYKCPHCGITLYLRNRYILTEDDKIEAYTCLSKLSKKMEDYLRRRGYEIDE